MLLKVSQVCERLNCSLATVYALIERGDLECFRCPGIRVSEEQLAVYLESTKKGRSQNAQDWPEKTKPRPKTGRVFTHLDGDRLLEAWRKRGVGSSQEREDISQ